MMLVLTGAAVALLGLNCRLSGRTLQRLEAAEARSQRALEALDRERARAYDLRKIDKVRLAGLEEAVRRLAQRQQRNDAIFVRGFIGRPS